MTIEPCCYQKQLSQLFAEVSKRGHASYVTYSDTTIQHLLNWLVAYQPMVHLTIVFVTITVPTLRFLEELCKKTYYDMGKKEQVPLVSQLDIIAQNYPEEANNWFEDSLGTVNISKYNVGFRCIVAQTDRQSLLIQGSLNQDIVRGMQMVTVTSGQDAQNMYAHLKSIVKLHRASQI